MEFDLDADQAAVLDAVAALLARHAGVARARELGGDAPDIDAALEAALAEAGYLDLFSSPDLGPVGAALLTEAVARQVGVAPIGARAMVAPALGVGDVATPIALKVAGSDGPVRYGTAARTVMLLDGDRVSVVAVDPIHSEPVRSRFGYPMGRITPGGGRDLGPGAGDRMRAWWRVALAVEMAGTMGAALDMTVAYVCERKQFGRPIGSFQAVQHRLAECAVLVSGVRWMALEAAWLGAPDEASAAAVTQAIVAADRVMADTHQFTGALGFTTEYDLHLWTMRLPALRAEADQLGSAGRAVTAARWCEDGSPVVP